MDIVIIGGRHVGQGVSESLGSREMTVAFLEDDSAVIERANDLGVEAHETNISDAQSLSNAGVDRADAAIVATNDDGRNLLIAQLLRVKFGIDRLVVLVNDPRNLDPFDELEIETVCSTEALTAALGDALPRERNR